MQPVGPLQLVRTVRNRASVKQWVWAKGARSSSWMVPQSVRAVLVVRTVRGVQACATQSALVTWMVSGAPGMPPGRGELSPVSQLKQPVLSSLAGWAASRVRFP
jgi:hypothetical protein